MQLLFVKIPIEYMGLELYEKTDYKGQSKIKSICIFAVNSLAYTDLFKFFFNLL